MIASLHIENYQSHRDTLLEFTPGVNILTGVSDSGKTAVFRALDWVCNNRPPGDAFRSDWGGDTRVTLRLGDGTEVVRLRTNSKNLYVLNGVELEAFGADVPPEVRDALGMTFLNWQRQLDSPFLLSESPGEAARLLNSVVDLDVIDRALSAVASRVRASDQRQAELEGQIQELGVRAARFENLEALRTAYQSAEGRAGRLSGKRDHQEILRTLLSDIHRAEVRVAELEPRAALDPRLADLEADGEALEGVRRRREGLQRAVAEVRAQQARVRREDRLADFEPALREVEAQASSLSKRREDRRGLASLMTQVRASAKAGEAWGETLDRLSRRWTAEMPDHCPLCGKRK